MSTFIQRSFAGGEIAPSVYGRVDQTKYSTGLRTCRNFIVMRHGGVANRPGTGFIGEVKDSTKKVRLLEFQFNADQTYVLEFGDLYMRVHKNGGQVVETGKATTGITNAVQAVVSAPAHGFLDGDEVVMSGVGGMVEVNSRNFLVANKTAGTFELTDLGGTPIDSTGFGTYTTPGIASRIYEIVTPYTEAQLFSLNHVQSADLVTIVHPLHAPRDLSRTGDASWSLDVILFVPNVTPPDGGSVVKGGAGGNIYRYQVTALADETLEESIPGSEDSRNIIAMTNANPGVFQSSGNHNFIITDKVAIVGMASNGVPEIPDGDYYIVAIPGVNTFQISATIVGLPLDTSAYGVYGGGGATTQRDFISAVSASAPSPTAPHVLSWPAVAGVEEYNIYREANGVFGFVGVAGSPTFADIGVVEDTTDTPPKERNPFDEPGKYPSTVTYYQQRRIFGNTSDDPEKVWTSRSGSFKNFTTSFPIQDDDAVTFNLAGRQVNAVQNMVDLGGLLMFTSGGEWNIGGDQAGILRPGEVNPKAISYNGSGKISPILVGNTILYLQARGSKVRDLGFDFQVDGYQGNDLTIFSAHLFDDFTLADWSYQQIPHSVVWCVRSDGILLGLTYIREHQVWGWHRHDFDGTVESVASVSEGTEDAVYLVVKRTVNGRDVRYVERFKTRRVADIVDSVYMDSSLSFDGRNTGATTMEITGGPAWDNTKVLTLTASTPQFVATDVGNAVFLTASDGSQMRFTIEGYTSPTIVTGRVQKAIPLDLQASPTTSWAKAVDEIGNLHHLEGKAVSVLGDGFVVASPNNVSTGSLTVTDGKITLERAYSVVHVGLPYTSDMETLDIDTAQGETIVDKKKLIQKLTIFVEDSRGIWGGCKPPEDDTVDPLKDLQELKIRNAEGYDAPVGLTTGVVEFNFRGGWNSNGRIFIRQVDPLPLSVLAVAPAGYLPFSRGG